MIAKAAVDFLKEQLAGAIDSSRQRPTQSNAPHNSEYECSTVSLLFDRGLTS